MNEKQFRTIMVNILTAAVMLSLTGVVCTGLYRLARPILWLGCG